MTEPKKPRRGNPPTSPWYATPPPKRHTARKQFSLTPEVDALVDELALEPDLGDRSAVIEAAVRMLHASKRKPTAR